MVSYPRVASFRTSRALAEYLASLGCPLPIDETILPAPLSPLSQPLEIPWLYGKRRVGNRFAVQPMEGWDGEPDGRPSELTRRRWLNFGRSGAKLIWGGEAVAVLPEGRANPNQLILNDRTASALAVLHSSLDRSTELARLELRDRLRPDFIIYSGNDLAADMIEFGSDYLLGLSTFAPELFAARDLAWKRNEAAYLELRDLIQYLGWIGFREPVPAYKHSAAIFLKLTGGLETDEPHPRAARREARDCALLADAAKRLERIMHTDSCPR